MKWPEVPLAKVAKEFISGGTPSTKVEQYWTGDIPWITGADVTDKIVTTGRKCITQEAVESSATHIVPEGAILLVTRTGVGKVAKAGTNIAISQDLTGVTLKDSIDTDFVVAAIQHKIHNLIHIQQGAIIKGVLRKDIEKLEIPLPPLSEQRRIVKILDQADALRKKRAEADKRAERILIALFYKMFGDPATNPKGQLVVQLRKLVVPVERRDPADRPDDRFVYIDIAGVDGLTGSIVVTKEMLGAEAPSRARQIVNENDVIISTVRPYLRATALVPHHLDNQICSTGFCVLRARERRGFGYLYALSRLQWFTDQLNARARGASYPAVTDRDILNLAVPYIDQPKAHETFDAHVLTVLRMQEKRAHSAKTIENIFQSLLHRAFTGDLTAKWRDAHMKELLAEMELQAKALNLSYS